MTTTMRCAGGPIAADEPDGARDPVVEAELDLEYELAGDLDLLCPGCGQDLTGADRYTTFRVCPTCGRHFSLPARERLALILDPESFVETNAVLVSSDPLMFQDDPREPSGDTEPSRPDETPEAVMGGVLTGVGTILGSPVVAIVLDLAASGGSIGAVAGEKITLGLEQARENRLPALLVCASGRGPGRSQDGLLALAQLVKIASATSNLRRSGVLMIAVVTDPTVGNVFTGFANQADLILAEVGAQVGGEQSIDYGGAPVAGIGNRTAEIALGHGMVDAVVDRTHLQSTLGTILGLLHRRGGAGSMPHVGPTTATLGSGQAAPVWEAAVLARHPDRPDARAYLDRIATEVVEVHGDRVSRDDPGVMCGLGRLSGQSVAIIAGLRGRASVAGVRKSDRMLRLAGHLELPVVIFIDSPGVAAIGHDEVDGIGAALGQTMHLLALLPVPIVTVILGEAGEVSGMAMGIGDRMLMLEHAVYNPIAADTVRVPDRPGSATRAVTARECLRLGLIDVIVPEPSPAAHADRDAAAHLIRTALGVALAEVRALGPRRLLDERARRMRYLGQTTPEGRAAARREVVDLQELQRNLTRSLSDWRERWEERTLFNQRRGRHAFHLPRPDLSGRISALRGHQAPGDSGADRE